MSDRLRFALKHTAAEHWTPFERLASAYVTDEYGELRTLARPSGDEGRDSILYQPVEEPQYVLQYSVAKDWARKIRRTARLLSDKHPEAIYLIFLTPHELGAAGDDVKRDVRQRFHINLDIRDAHWLTEREERSPATRAAADQYSRIIVEPLLRESGLIARAGSSLTDHESRAALLYLVLQREDDDRARHLTKLCFDALVKAVLRDTDNEHRMHRDAIRGAVRDLCPTSELKDVHEYVDRALARMTKRAIRHWSKEDEFCLTYEERLRLAEGVARLAILNDEFEQEVQRQLKFVADGLDEDLSFGDCSQIVLRVRRVMERFLFERGEAFVESLSVGQEMLFIGDELQEVANRDLLKHPETSSLRHNMRQLVTETVERIIVAPGIRTHEFLGAIADAYTLFAFLRETPNVQSAVTKLFAHGEIWLDTSVVLPLLAEELLDLHERGYTRLIEAALDAGVKIYVTNGVVDEINSHIEVALQAWRSPGSWNSRTPFLLATYIWSGRPNNKFGTWLENFRGRQRSIDDLAEYLLEERRIQVADLHRYVNQAPDELRWQVENYWHEVHQERRQTRGQEVSDTIVRHLAAHDTENYLGVIERRSGEQIGNPFGYTTWWLTTDRFARTAAREIAERVGLERLDSPVMSFDFLTYYLAVGPARRQLTRSLDKQLPLGLDTSLLDALPKDLLAAAEHARRDVQGQSERVVRRRIRDHLDQEKLRQKKLGKTGLEAIEDDIRMALRRKRATV